MKRVLENGVWSLMCPDQCPGLVNNYGEKFEELYTRYEEEGKARRTVKAQELWFAILESQIETGVPYLLAKDNVNSKSNHQNIGVVKQSNLCAEIIQYTDEETTAICTLSSMVLKNFIIDGKFDFNLLYKEVRKVVRALNKVININSYSTEKGRKGGLEQRAIAIGTQGLADVFIMLGHAFDSEKSREINIEL